MSHYAIYIWNLMSLNTIEVNYVIQRSDQIVGVRG